MGASSRNIVKLISGTAIGAGLAALFARGTQKAAEPDETVVVDPMTTEPVGIGVTTGSPQSEGIGEKAKSVKAGATNKVTEVRTSLRDRWQRAQTEGEQAKVEREAELRAYFREKVDDPTAFPPGAPTRQDR